MQKIQIGVWVWPRKKSVAGRGGGRVISVLACYSEDPSSNPAGYNFIIAIIIMCAYEKTKINEKEAWLGH